MSGLHATCLALVALGAALAGLAALGLAMDRHWEQLHGRGTGPAPSARRRLRHAGTVGLLASLLACIALRGAAQGWVAWAGMLTAAALTLALALAYAARAVARLGWTAAALALLALAGSFGA
ncbi:DUF3325 domain-containing protein [uncultured Massilia sp.]|uniref:DUF3325 domain-containing protein n=1 Tax=uncultured Massilia sp. TaxID=169973 RepID=UPI0025D95A1C|nr:DUF3325 domain-containing protein [uncultured Massilia sp.]